MATQCRSTKTSHHKRTKLSAYVILCLLVVFGGVCGFCIARLTAPLPQPVTVTKTVDIPVYESDMFSQTADIYLYQIPISESLQRYIYEICADKKVPVPLVMAMIEHESGFDPEAISPTNDYGLMQINEINRNWLEEDYHCADMLNPYQNVYCGISIISAYITKYQDIGKALMAYNMGDYGAQKAWDGGITSTGYSTGILELMAHYEEVSRGK